MYIFEIMITSAEQAVQEIKSDSNVYIHSAAAAPKLLTQAMSKRSDELKNVSIYQIHTEGEAPYATPEMEDSFIHKALFVGNNTRNSIQNGQGSYIPIFLSEAPSLFRKQIIDIDVALITVSPPDDEGYCSLGTSVDISLAAFETAKFVIAQVNNFMPRTNGDALIHISRINILVLQDTPLPEIKPHQITQEEKIIGNNVAQLIDDGATLQMGIGSIPNAVLDSLSNHKNLGIHSEMFSDGVIPLIEKGIINGECKHTNPGIIVSSFVVGSKKTYDFIDRNPMIQMLDLEYVNNYHVIQKNPKVTAINSAIEIDLTGQVCADSIGCKIYSGVGGQMDFIKGAAASEGGKPIIALTSTTKSGSSKIVSFLKQGAGVVTTRAQVHFVVTEYGVAYLYGKTIEERAKLMIGIAHPAHREQLKQDSKLLLA